MPGPTTEILNEDIKELKGDLRDVRSNVEILKADVHRTDIGVAEMRTDIRRNNFDGPKGDVQRVEIGLAELRTEFRFAKWLSGLLLVTALTGVASGIWWASKLDTKLVNLEEKFDKQESKIDRLESLMVKVLEQTRPTPLPVPDPATPKPR